MDDSILHIETMHKSLFRYIDLAYFARFVLILVPLYFFHIFYLGITSPEGDFYSQFLDHYLNYINWVRNCVLYSSNLIAHAFGLRSWLEGSQVIRTEKVSVTVWLPCLGLGIMSFWIAFIIAHKDSWKKKLYWCMAGVAAIWFLNCWRISLLLIALEKNWHSNIYLNHHDAFNLGAYAIIIILIYCYIRQGKTIISYPAKAGAGSSG